jgi:hypothetical protein
MPEGTRVFVRELRLKYQHFYFFELRYESCQDFSNVSCAFHQHVSFRDVPVSQVRQMQAMYDV